MINASFKQHRLLSINRDVRRLKVKQSVCVRASACPGKSTALIFNVFVCKWKAVCAVSKPVAP